MHGEIFLEIFPAHVVGLPEGGRLDEVAALDHPVAPLVAVRGTPAVVRRDEVVQAAVTTNFQRPRGRTCVRGAAVVTLETAPCATWFSEYGLVGANRTGSEAGSRMWFFSRW